LRKSRSGFTLVELLVVVMLIATLMSILLPALVKARQASGRMTCANYMRQIGLGIWTYDKDFGCLPNAQWNWAKQLMPQFGLKNANLIIGPGPYGAKIAYFTEMFKCPANEFISQNADPKLTYTGASISYAPVVDSGYLDGDNDGVPDSNMMYCAWSTCRNGYSTAANTPWQLRALDSCAPNTVLLLEYFNPAAKIRFSNEWPPGYAMADFGANPRMGTINWSGAGIFSTAPISGVPDIGGYTWLAAYAFSAAQFQTSRSLDTMVHAGQANLLAADGSVTARPLRGITSRSPRDLPLWTRNAD
jgi:prepilin-type N-terminal cleavage/methylation domain-containing protein/prepilin-type processing-associated H-X9-DG protein